MSSGVAGLLRTTSFNTRSMEYYGIDSTAPSALALTTVEQRFIDYNIVPDVIPIAPKELMTAMYPDGVTVELGNELSLLQVQIMPCVSYEADSDQFYTLVLTDPDVPSREIPALGEFKHWLVGNIPGRNVDAGEVLAAYIGSTPPPLTGLHRYTFLVYLQTGKLTFEASLLSNADRVGFSISEFAEKYNLGDPIAGNFFLCDFGISVQLL